MFIISLPNFCFVSEILWQNTYYFPQSGYHKTSTFWLLIAHHHFGAIPDDATIYSQWDNSSKWKPLLHFNIWSSYKNWLSKAAIKIKLKKKKCLSFNKMLITGSQDWGITCAEMLNIFKKDLKDTILTIVMKDSIY